jgi:hypothetical protein
VRALAIRIAAATDWRDIDTHNPPPSLQEAAE